MIVLVVVGCVSIFVAGLLCSPPNGYASPLEAIAGFSLFFAFVGGVTWLLWLWIASANHHAVPEWSFLVASTAGSIAGAFVNMMADPGYE
ncbi:MAG: hypothetical protein ACREGB_00805 [Candidatus Saccharimonadales bacterium]